MSVTPKPSRTVAYAAFFSCGVLLLVFRFRAFVRLPGDDLLGPYVVTVVWVGLLGLLGVFLTLRSGDFFLGILAVLTIGLTVYFRFYEGTIFFEVYSLIYALAAVGLPIVSWHLTRYR